jgi:hypothetical protein
VREHGVEILVDVRFQARTIAAHRRPFTIGLAERGRGEYDYDD